MRTGPTIELKSICKAFGPGRSNRPVLSDVSFTAEGGKITVLLGPSGCGKTTLLRIISGLEAATSGEVRVDSKVRPGVVQDCVLMFQNYPLFPWLTAADNVMFGLKIHGRRFANPHQIALSLLDRVGLRGYHDFYPSRLSGGMRQRVALARALAVEPSIILMDEPFSALDSFTRSSMHKLLIDLWLERGATIVFVTHDIDEALFLADRMLLCSAQPGRVVGDFEVDFGRPRAESIRASSRFQERRVEILRILNAEGAKAQSVL